MQDIQNLIASVKQYAEVLKALPDEDKKILFSTDTPNKITAAQINGLAMRLALRE
jgi:hypothetical protein